MDSESSLICFSIHLVSFLLKCVIEGVYKNSKFNTQEILKKSKGNLRAEVIWMVKVSRFNGNIKFLESSKRSVGSPAENMDRSPNKKKRDVCSKN